MALGKRLEDARKTFDRDTIYDLEEAVRLVKASAKAKFDETIDIAVRLGVDPKHADQMVRGAVSLPHGTGKTVRVLVFAKGDYAKEAEKAGADFVGAEDLVTKISGGWLDFDVAVATPDTMGMVGRLGKILGPRGLMPNPKTGTVTFEVADAVREIKAGKIEFRVEKAGIVHAPVGKASFDEAALIDNIRTVVDALIKAKPAAAKGTYLRSIAVSSTMGIGVKVNTARLLAQKEALVS